MDEVQPVRPSPGPLGDRGGLIGVALVALVAVAILKPWGSSEPGRGVGATAVASSPPVPSLTASPSPDAGYGDVGYDPSIFGIAPPPARWGLLPVGYLVTFGYVAEVPDAASTAPPAPTASQPVRPSPMPSAGSSVATATPAATPADGGPAWASRFEVSDGTHLVLIGINMPTGFSVQSSSLEQLANDGGWQPVQLVSYPPPWPAHFAVVGLPRRATDGHLVTWPAGHYRLTLRFDPTDISRSVDIIVPPGAVTP